MSFIIKGKVWIFGNDISTDLMSPAEYQYSSWEEKKFHILDTANPHFPKEVKDGDIIVAGRNFGCGSSRESAPKNLMNLGIKCVIGESFGRIFFRALTFILTVFSVATSSLTLTSTPSTLASSFLSSLFSSVIAPFCFKTSLLTVHTCSIFPSTYPSALSWLSVNLGYTTVQ